MIINGYAVFLVSFLVNLAALSPVIYAGDSSLFAAASFSLGSAHPPGYPLLIQLGKLFTFIPFGNIAFKVNLLSAVFGALACLMVFRASMELTRNRYASWAAALICGISPLFFLESIKAEAYTLNAFLSMTVFLFGLRMLNGGDFFKNSLAAFFIVGLGMGNHHTIAFSGLALLWPLALRRREASLKWAGWGLLFFFAGFSVNLLLYLRSLAIGGSGGLILYSYAGDFDSFVRIFLRRDFGGTETAVKALASHWLMGWYYGLKNTLYFIAYQSTRPVMPFLLLGVAALSRKPKVLLYFGVSAALWLPVLGRMVFSGAAPDVRHVQIVSVYFLPVLPLLYCLVATGFSATMEFARKMQWQLLGRALPYAVAAAPLVLLPYSIRDYSLSGNFLCYDYGRDTLNALPPKSLLMNHSDNASFTTFYMRSVERLREDLLVMNTAGKGEAFGVESSPPWKYAGLYPDFFRSRETKLSEINAEFAVKKKLFVSHQMDRSRVFSNYRYYPYLLTAALWPENLPSEDFKSHIRRMYRERFEMLNFERLIDSPPPRDILAEEIQGFYGYASAVYSSLLPGGGQGVIDDYRALALRVSPLDRFVWPFTMFLLDDAREGEAFAFLDWLEGDGAMRPYAEALRQETLAEIKHRYE